MTVWKTNLQLHLYFLVFIKVKQNHVMGQFGDSRFGDNSVNKT